MALEEAALPREHPSGKNRASFHLAVVMTEGTKNISFGRLLFVKGKDLPFVLVLH